MKARTILLGLMLLPLSLAVPAQTPTPKPATATHPQSTADAAARKQLAAYLVEYRNDPTNADLRDKIIESAKTLKPAPLVPQAVRTEFAKAMAQLKAAATPGDDKAAAAAFEQVAAQAPWWADAYLNAASAYAKAGDLSNAKLNLALYNSAVRPGVSTAAADDLESEIGHQQAEIDRQQAEIARQKAEAERQQAQQQFQQALQDFQKNPSDSGREQIIKMALEMKPAPEIPDEAERSLIRGKEAFKDAKSVAAFKQVVAEFQKASLAAPWSGDIYYNLGVVQDKAGDYAGAIQNLNLYLLATPDASDAKAVRNLIYEIEYRKDKADMGQQLAKLLRTYPVDQQQVMALIDKGADVNVNDSMGWAALSDAAELGLKDIVRAMLDKGANIDAKGPGGWSPLVSAVENGELDTARLLIQRGANVNAKDDSGVTVLMSSVCNDFSEAPDRPTVVHLLIDSGASLNAKDSYGYSALAYASGHMCTYPAIVQILQQAGAQ